MKKMFLLVLVVILLIPTGCWDVRDINNRAFVTAIGMDVPEKSSGKYTYKVSFLFMNPLKAKTGNADQITSMQTVKADSVTDAIQMVQSHVSRTVDLSHLRVLVIGETLAKQKEFSEVTNFFQKNSQIALRMRLMFAQDCEARDIIKVNSRFERSVSSSLVHSTQLEKEQALLRIQRFFDFYRDLLTTKGTAFGSRVLIDKKQNLLIRNGGAVYRKGRLTGWLSDEETLAANWIVGKAGTVVTGKTESGAYSYLTKNRRVEIDPVKEKGRLGFVVRMQVVGDITEEQGKSLKLSEPKNIKKLEAVISRTITKQVSNAVYKSQKVFRADYLGFGKAMKIHDPKAFAQINWEEAYPDIPVKVRVKAKIQTYDLSD